NDGSSGSCIRCSIVSQSAFASPDKGGLEMSLLQRVLIAGTGPAAVQLAVLIKRLRYSRVGIAGRRSVRSKPFFDALHQNGGAVAVDTTHTKHSTLQGECHVDAVFHEFGNIEEQWDTLILAVTADAY